MQLLTSSDFIAVRALLLAQVGPELALDTLPDALLMTPGLAGVAEATVSAYLGADWPLFTLGATGPLPVYYAQGNADVARGLVRAACVHFLAARLAASGLLAQVVPTSKASVDQRQTFASIDWSAQATCFEAEGWRALQLVRRAVPVPGRRFASPSGGAAGHLPSQVQLPPRGYCAAPRDRW